MKKIISHCPVCSEELTVKTLSCNSCHTEITGDFKLSKFNYLSEEELYFVEVFIKNRGSIKAVEKELNVSYPTVKKSLDQVIINLGYQINDDEEKVESLDEKEGNRFAKINILVKKNDKKVVNLSIPLEFINVLSAKKFKLDQVQAFTDGDIVLEEIIKQIKQGARGELVNIESSDGSHVIISVK